ncbi:unnamed protein product [Closterium sp. Naga37s-1]|nr:unnamed protein product [Closterium sp. Naga37s-1]
MADEEINYESDAGLDSLFFTRPKGPNPPPTPYLYVANCGAEAEMTYAALADVFSSFGHVRRVVPAGAANLTRIFVVFGGRSRAEASAAAESALQALSGKPCAEAGGRKMHIQFAVGKRSAPTRDIEKDKWIGPLPAAVSDFVSRAEQLPELTGCPEVCMPLDQLTINEYATGVGLAPHIDTHAAFEGAVLSLSLAGPAIMEFRRPMGPQPVGKQPLGKKKVVAQATAGGEAEEGATLRGETGGSDERRAEEENREEENRAEEKRGDEKRTEEKRAEEKRGDGKRAEDRRVLFLPPRSLLVLTGEARYAWSHYIPNHKIDHINGQDFPRAPRRVSYTFRRVRFGPCGCAYPEFCDAPRMESVAENGKVPTDRDRAAGSEGVLVERTGAGRLLVKEKGSEGMRRRVEDGCCGGSVGTHSHEGVEECAEEGEEEKKEEQRVAGGSDGETVVTHSHQGVRECGGEEEEEERAEEEEGKGITASPHVDPSKTLESPQTTPAVERDLVHKVYDAIAPHFNPSDAAASPQTTPAVERDFVHKVYDAIAPHFSATRFARWPKVAEFLLSLPRGSLVLDAGPPLVSICSQRGFEAFVADTLSLPLASSRFDAAISVAVLHHLSSETRRKHALREMLRVVKKGGRVLVTVWAREQENPGLLDKWTPLIGRMADRWVGDVGEGGGEERGRERGGEREERTGGGLGGIEEDRETSNEENACPRRGLEGKEILREEAATAGEGTSAQSAEAGKGAENLNLAELRGGGSGEVKAGGGSELGKSTGVEASQEFLVPWHLPCHRVEIGSAAAAQHVASGFARRDEAKGSVVYNRYYYVFTRGELER